MGGDRFREEAVLAAVKPLKTANRVPSQNLARPKPRKAERLFAIRRFV